MCRVKKCMYLQTFLKHFNKLWVVLIKPGIIPKEKVWECYHKSSQTEAGSGFRFASHSFRTNSFTQRKNKIRSRFFGNSLHGETVTESSGKQIFLHPTPPQSSHSTSFIYCVFVICTSSCTKAGNKNIFVALSDKWKTETSVFKSCALLKNGFALVVL